MLGTPSQAPIPLHPINLNFSKANIRPVLVKHCYECHSADAEELEGGLYLDSREGIQQGGDSGPVLERLTPSGASPAATRHCDTRASKCRPLASCPTRTIADFERWVRMGAPDPRGAAKSPRPGRPTDWNLARRFLVLS